MLTCDRTCAWACTCEGWGWDAGGVAGCREKPSVVCRASAARVNTATAGYAAAFDAAASAACVACAAFAFAAAAASVGAGAAAAAHVVLLKLLLQVMLEMLLLHLLLNLLVVHLLLLHLMVLQVLLHLLLHGSMPGLHRRTQCDDTPDCGPPASICPSSCDWTPAAVMFWWATVAIWLLPTRICRGFGAMARGRACWSACATADIEGCWDRGEGSKSAGDRLVEARVCCTERIVWASADSAAAWDRNSEWSNEF